VAASTSVFCWTRIITASSSSSFSTPGAQR
jgi:hypothetical protein